MKIVILKLIKKFINIFMSYRRDLSIDFSSEISPAIFRNLKGTHKYKTIVRNSVLSGNVTTGKGCRLNNVYLCGNIKLDRFVSINGPGTRISSRLEGIEIGSFTSIASNVIIQEDYHRQDKISTYYMSRNLFKGNLEIDLTTKGKIVIEEDVWIGSNSVILSGVKIGRGSIIGAGSIVTKNIPRYSVVVGNPAKVIRKRFNDSIIQKLESSKWWELTEEEMIKHRDKFMIDLSRNSNELIFD